VLRDEYLGSLTKVSRIGVSLIPSRVPFRLLPVHVVALRLTVIHWLHKAQEMTKDQFKREVERELTGEDKEPWEIVYFKFYKSQIPVIDRALETAALMLGSNRSRGYCLEMICADFLAGANLDNGDPETLLFSMIRFFPVSARRSKADVPEELERARNMTAGWRNGTPLRLDPLSYDALRQRVLRRDNWRCQLCGAMSNLEVHHQQFRGHAGEAADHNLITLCYKCHRILHG
jgi:hypothetical protein